MAPEVAPRELDQRVVPVDPSTLRHTLVEERVRLLLPREPAAADHGLELAMHQDVRQPLALTVDPRVVEDGADLVPRQANAALECRNDHPLCPRPRPFVEPEVAIPPGVPLLHARPADGEQPSDVVASDEVPGRPEYVGPDDRARDDGVLDVRIDEPGRALSDRPFRRPVLLRLHRQVPGDDLLRRLEALSREPRVGHPAPRKIQRLHRHGSGVYGRTMTRPSRQLERRAR